MEVIFGWWVDTVLACVRWEPKQAKELATYIVIPNPILSQHLKLYTFLFIW